MTFTDNDKNELYKVWVLQKERLRLSVVKVCQALNMSVHDFANIMHGQSPITLSFLYQLSKLIEVDLFQALPSFCMKKSIRNEMPVIRSCIILDGEVLDVVFNANQVVIEYQYQTTKP